VPCVLLPKAGVEADCWLCEPTCTGVVAALLTVCWLWETAGTLALWTDEADSEPDCLLSVAEIVTTLCSLRVAVVLT